MRRLSKTRDKYRGGAVELEYTVIKADGCKYEIMEIIASEFPMFLDYPDLYLKAAHGPNSRVIRFEMTDIGDRAFNTFLETNPNPINQIRLAGLPNDVTSIWRKSCKKI